MILDVLTEGAFHENVASSSYPSMTSNIAPHIHNRKLDALEYLVEAANEKPLLVTYWYKHDLARIHERFDVRVIDTAKDIKTGTPDGYPWC